MDAVADTEIDALADPRKKIFAANLRKRMLDMGWSPSDLARHADMNRDNVSRYLRAVSLPGTKQLRQLAFALKCEMDELLPEPFDGVTDDGWEMRPCGKRGYVRLVIDMIVPTSTAAEIVRLLTDEPDLRVADGK